MLTKNPRCRIKPQRGFSITLKSVTKMDALTLSLQSCLQASPTRQTAPK
jgi:hypothetical protein